MMNANLGDFSDRPLKDKKSISISDKDTEMAEYPTGESAALQSHLLWLTDLLNCEEEPNSRAII